MLDLLQLPLHNLDKKGHMIRINEKWYDQDVLRMNNKLKKMLAAINIEEVFINGVPKGFKKIKVKAKK